MKIDFSQFETIADFKKYAAGRIDGIKTRQDAENYIRKNMPKESWYQAQILIWIKEKLPDAFAWKAAAGPYQRQGIPDICVIYRGRFFGLEVKRPLIGKLSGVQKLTLDQIRKAGGIAEVVSTPKDAAQILLQEKEERA